MTVQCCAENNSSERGPQNQDNFETSQNHMKMKEGCPFERMAHLAFAIIIFENAWQQTFGKSKPLLKSLNNIMIEWSTDYKL